MLLQNIKEEDYVNLSEFSFTHFDIKWKVLLSDDVWLKLNLGFNQCLDDNIKSVLLFCRVRQLITCCFKKLMEGPISLTVTEELTVIDGSEHNLRIEYSIIDCCQAMSISEIN